MTEKETGRPAFPHHVVCANGWAETQELQGMTLRDYFAAKTMQGLITSRHTDYGNGWYDEERLANSAYNMADAMLKARDGNS